VELPYGYLVLVRLPDGGSSESVVAAIEQQGGTLDWSGDARGAYDFAATVRIDDGLSRLPEILAGQGISDPLIVELVRPPSIKPARPRQGPGA
jgi:hypothetical protein